MKKRIFSLLLILCLMLSLVPFGTLAEDVTEPMEVTEATETTETTETTVVTEATEATETTEATGVTETTEVTEPTEVTEATEVTEPGESEPTAAQKVQSLIDALPETVTVENREAVETQLTAIDDAKLPLTDEEREGLDFGKYNAAIAALNELDGMAGAEVPEMLDEAGLKAALEKGVYVAGVEALTDYIWDPAGLKMDKIQDGIWQVLIDLSHIGAGTYEYKICAGGGWDYSFGNPDGLCLDTTGLASNLTITIEDDCCPGTLAIIFDLTEYDYANNSGAKLRTVISRTPTTEAELRSYIDAGASNITLGADIELSSPLTISGKPLTLDLNGHKLSSSASFTVWVGKYENSTVVPGTLTVTDSGSGGTIENTNTETNSGRCIKVTGSAFTLKKGTIRGQYGVGMDGRSPSFQMQGGSIVATVEGVYVRGNFTFSGGTISGNICSINNGGTSTLKDGRIEAGDVGCFNGYIYFLGTELSDSVQLKATGGDGSCVTFKNSDGTYYAATATVSGMTITAPTTPTAPTGTVFAGWFTDKGEKWNFSQMVTQNMTLTAKWSDGSNVTSEEELRACIEAGISNIKLGEDITLKSTLTISGKPLTLDLNGHKLTSAQQYTVEVLGNLTASGGTIENTASSGDYVAVRVNGGSFTLNSGKITAPGTGSDAVRVSSGTFTMNGGDISGGARSVYIHKNATMNANGGTATGVLRNRGTIQTTSGTGTVFTGSQKAINDTAPDENGKNWNGVVKGGNFEATIRDGIYKVTFVDDGKTVATQYRGNACADVPAYSKEGYTLKWYNGDKIWDFNQKVTADMTLTAKFVPITYTITYNPGAADATGTIANGTKEYGKDFTLNMATYTRKGFIQVGWKDGSGNIYYGGQTYSVDADLNLTAVWEEEVEYTISFTKTVKQNGSTKPGEATFSLYICGMENLPEISGTIDCNGKVTTKGTGDFTGTLTISGSQKLVDTILQNGIYIREWDSEMDKWTYDNHVYFLKLNKNEDGYQLNAYAATAKTEDKATVYSYDSSKTVKMTFTNTYGTATTADTSNPKTSDAIYIAAATMLLSAMALIAIVPKRKGNM